MVCEQTSCSIAWIYGSVETWDQVAYKAHIQFNKIYNSVTIVHWNRITKGIHLIWFTRAFWFDWSPRTSDWLSWEHGSARDSFLTPNIVQRNIWSLIGNNTNPGLFSLKNIINQFFQAHNMTKTLCTQIFDWIISYQTNHNHSKWN